MTRKIWAYWGFFGVAIALLTACTNTVETPTVKPPPAEQTTGQITENPVAESSDLRIYWVKDAGDRLVLVPENVTPVKDTPENQLKKLFAQLLENAPNSEASSTIPAGTTLLSLTIQPDGIVVNLSEAFTSGGGSASMMGRLGQVIYTATSLDPEAAVWLQVEGQPLEVLGGEGLEIDQPMTRKLFTENFEM